MMSAKKRIGSGGLSGGFTIVELIIAVIIIGVLATIIIPVLTDRSAQARIAAAQSDMEHIANAQERVTLDTGFMVRLFALDDSRGGNGIGFSIPNQNDPIDGFADERLNSYYQQVPEHLFIDPETQNFLAPARASSLFDQLVSAETSFASVGPAWRGPYLNWQRDSDVVGETPPAKDNIGDDPWGNNYLFFTREGLLKEPEGEFVSQISSIEQALKRDSIAGPDPFGPYDCRVFDRPTILSLGPNGMPGDESDPRFGAGDDLIRHW